MNQLFIDDHHILYRSGTRRVFCPPSPHSSEPLVAPTEPWETALAWNSIYRNPATGRYQLWYQSYIGDDLQDRRYGCVVCYAESDDGIHFTKPELDLFSFGEHERTNIVLLGSGGHSFRYGCSVLVDDAAPAAQRYRMAYFDWTETDGGQMPGLCIAFSPDGIVWTKHLQAPLSVISYGALGGDLPLSTDLDRPWAVPLSMSDGTDVFFDPTRNAYVWYGKMWIDGPEGHMAWKHAMGRTESADFIHWSTPELVLAPDDEDPPHVEFHTTPVFWHEGVYICLNQILDRAVGGGVIDVELMLSRDGRHWQRPFRDQFFLPRGEPGSFTGGSTFTNSTPVLLDDEIRFYYGGYSAGATSSDNERHVSGIGMARLRRDRFAGIAPLASTDLPTQRRPVADIGQVTLKKLSMTGIRGLTLNADASDGTIRAEFLDDTGRRVPGFTAEEAVPVRGDSLTHEVCWAQQRTLPDGDCMLRLHLHQSTIYSVRWLSD